MAMNSTQSACKFLPSETPIPILTFSRTPWLTTRRRTCPICKGDVVRSMDLASSPSSSASSYSSLVLLGEPESSDSHLNPNTSPLQTTASQPQAVIIHVSESSLHPTIAETRDESPSSAIPIPNGSSANQESAADQEDLAATLVGSRQSGDGLCMPPPSPSRREDEDGDA